MPNPGYPDWQRVQYASGSLIDSGNTVLSSVYNSPLINVQNWNQIVFNMFDDDNGFHYVDVNWYATAGAGITVATSEFGFPQYPGGIWVTTVKAPYMQYTITPDTGSHTFGTVWNIYGSVPQFTTYQTKGAGWQNMSFSQALAANATFTSSIRPWYEGEVLLNATASAGGACKGDIYYHDPNGNFDQHFYSFNVPASGNLVPNKIWLPPYHTKVKLSNGASAQTVAVEMIPAGP